MVTSFLTRDLSRPEANTICTACSILARGRSNCCYHLPVAFPRFRPAKYTEKTRPTDYEVTGNLSDKHRGERTHRKTDLFTFTH